MFAINAAVTSSSSVAAAADGKIMTFDIIFLRLCQFYNLIMTFVESSRAALSLRLGFFFNSLMFASYSLRRLVGFGSLYLTSSSSHSHALPRFSVRKFVGLFPVSLKFRV